jgi:hypothetical protein
MEFLWSYEVFHYSISIRVVIIFRDITYIIIIFLFVTFGSMRTLLTVYVK